MSAVAEPFVLTSPKGVLDACPQCGSKSPAVWFREAGKCVICEAERVRARVMSEECDRAAHDIALNTSLLALKLMAVTTHDGWIDPTFALGVRDKDANSLAAAVYYLTMRGLTRPHPIYPGVFKIVDPTRPESQSGVRPS